MRIIPFNATITFVMTNNLRHKIYRVHKIDTPLQDNHVRNVNFWDTSVKKCKSQTQIDESSMKIVKNELNGMFCSCFLKDATVTKRISSPPIKTRTNINAKTKLTEAISQ